MNGRMYDAVLGRFLSPDNYVQDPYNTQSFNRYGYVWNNPLSYNDPSGEFLVSALIGAAIGVLTNGINNVVNDRPFFRGAGKAALFGFMGGAVSFGIGHVAGMISNTYLSVAYQVGMRGLTGGMFSGAQGGSFGSGFLSGALSSGISSAVSSVKIDSNFWSASVQVVSGGVAGGFGSQIAGGNFMDGLRQGLITSALNHAAHNLAQDLNRYFTSKEAAYDYAIEESILLDLGNGYIIQIEVSGFALKNGNYIVLDPSKNTRTRSYNPMVLKNGKLYVRYFGKLYEIKSQFHTHPSNMSYASGRIGVSEADLSMIYNTFHGESMSILYQGNEWVVSPGNQYKKFGYGYTLKNNGAW
jgi:hypothetical protein